MSGVAGVIGGGRMGAGIAQVLATVGYEVVVVEKNEGAVKEATTRIDNNLKRAAELGVLDVEPGVISQRIRFVIDISDLPGNAQLVIEAVPEDEAFKREVLTAVERAVSAVCVIASNTSSLSISQLAGALEEPQRFIGMHFFNPVPSSSLVEVVIGDRTSTETVDRAVGWVKELAKNEIVIKDSPGFATSRLGVLLGLEAMRMVEEGVADAQAIDRAMELGYRHPMGPLRLTDLVGLDVRLAIAEYLSQTLGERFDPPQLLRDKVARGELGRKTGQGFYHWT